MNWYIEVLKKYAVFTGRAHRTEYWMFVLFYLIVAIVLGVIDQLVGSGGILGSIYTLAVLLPSIGVAIRRLHDTSRSGWWLLIALVPIVGAIVLIVFLVQDSHADNQYGPKPKGVTT